MFSLYDSPFPAGLLITGIILFLLARVRKKIQLPTPIVTYLTQSIKDKKKRRLERLNLKDVLPTGLLILSISAFSLCTVQVAGIVATIILACFKRLNLCTTILTCVFILPIIAYAPMDAGNGMAGLAYSMCVLFWIVSGGIIWLFHTLIGYFNKRKITKMRLQKKQQLKEDNQRLSSQPDNSI